MTRVANHDGLKIEIIDQGEIDDDLYSQNGHAKQEPTVVKEEAEIQNSERVNP